MQLFNTFSAFSAFISLAAARPQVGVPFGLITIRSGTAVHNAGLSADASNNIQIGGSNENYLTFNFTEDYHITSNGLFLTVANGQFVLGTNPTLFTTDDNDYLICNNDPTVGYLAVRGTDGFMLDIVNPARTYTVQTIPVALRAFYRPQSSDAPLNTSTPTAVPTLAPQNISVTPTGSPNLSTSCGPLENCNTTFTGLPQVNAAQQTALGLGALVVGAAGALLL